MTPWVEKKLGDVLQLQRGFDLPSSARRAGDVPIVSSSGVTGFHAEAAAKAPGVVTGRYGTLGAVFYLRQDYWPLNTSLFVKDFKGTVPRFAAYLLESLPLAHSEGAGAVPGINRNVLHALDVRVPGVATQSRIATVLGAIDDLIENNRRRIRVLSGLIMLHFDRVERASLTSLTRSTIKQLCGATGAVQTGPFGSQLHESDYASEGVPVIMPKDIFDGRVDDSTIARVDASHVERLERHRLSAGDIVYGRRGAIGRRALVRPGNVGWLCGTGCLRITLDRAIASPAFVHTYLGKQSVISMIAARAVGSTMPNLNTSILQGLELDLPTVAIQREFEATVVPLDTLIETLHLRNATLRRLRDLLLPKLLSGEVDVSRLPLPPDAS